VTGTFSYSVDGEPLTAKRVLKAGAHTLTVTFTPADPTYQAASKTAPFTVLKGRRSLAWPNPAEIMFGMALGPGHLITVAPATASHHDGVNLIR
jgi:hypothetical protein